MERHRVLIIEDNPDTRRFLEVMLSKEFDVISAENGVIGVDFARNKSPDLILLDIMLPVLSGYDTCSLLKKDEKTKHIPVIYLSAKNTVADIAHGLSTGADDYVPKPFDYKELKARILARLRKSGENIAQPIHLGDLRIDPAKREVVFAGKRAQLTLTEFDILRFLASKAGSVITRDEILNEVWTGADDKTNDRTIDVHIRALRRKMPDLAKHIVSIYGVGYKYEK
jgi:DNA-binding response OmpR family regulator